MQRAVSIFLVVLLCGACAAPDEESAPAEAAAVEPVDEATAGRVSHEVVAGQKIYVPVYSHIYYHDDRRVINLAATLSIRNTDAQHAIDLGSVRYYDSEGALVRVYVDAPVRLAPMASRDFVVEQDDTSGGSGANFIVEWTAAAAVTDPVVEAVMISTSASQGISFVSTGRVLEEQATQPAE